MLELIAQGTNLDYRWRRQIPTVTPFQIGRSTSSFRVPWDSHISRNHVRLRLVEGRLLVQKQDDAANPVFFNGAEEETFWLEPGDHFVIGDTTFTLADDQVEVTQDLPHPIHQKTFTHQSLRKIRYRDADRRIDVLNRLPEIISSAGDEKDLLNRFLITLLEGIANASAIGLIRQSQQDADPVTDSSPPSIEVIHWDHRGSGSGRFQPSGKLIQQAISSKETVLHIWQSSAGDKTEYTVDIENDWAFVCPLDSQATPGWGIYVTGSNRAGSDVASGDGSGHHDLQGDIKFCELVGTTFKNLMQVKQLERRQASLRSFFSPLVLDAIADRDPEEALAPQECQVSVLFCDLRGFARTSEQYADELFKLLDQVSSSLDVVTSRILNSGGVIGDFHGDSAMGFWGWPLVQDDSAARAIQTAMDIRSEFNIQNNEQTDFRIGIGIATGMAVAGRIGSSDQVKVTVFGPVVNLASRLEGMTRLLNTSILTERTSIERLLDCPPSQMPSYRRIGKFQPFGIDSVIEVVQLLDQNDVSGSFSIEDFESAVNHFGNGEWEQSRKILSALSPEDTISKYLQNYMDENQNQAPENWQGVIAMKSK